MLILFVLLIRKVTWFKAELPVSFHHNHAYTHKGNVSVVVCLPLSLLFLSRRSSLISTAAGGCPLHRNGRISRTSGGVKSKLSIDDEGGMREAVGRETGSHSPPVNYSGWGPKGTPETSFGLLSPRSSRKECRYRGLFSFAVQLLDRDRLKPNDRRCESPTLARTILKLYNCRFHWRIVSRTYKFLPRYKSYIYIYCFLDLDIFYWVSSKLSRAKRYKDLYYFFAFLILNFNKTIKRELMRFQ